MGGPPASPLKRLNALVSRGWCEGETRRVDARDDVIGRRGEQGGEARQVAARAQRDAQRAPKDPGSRLHVDGRERRLGVCARISAMADSSCSSTVSSRSS